MEIKTHQSISAKLCGTPVKLEAGLSQVRLEADETMVVDSKGLVHGGFVFGLADYAAMIAVNDPNVVLGAAEVKFIKPVKIGDIMVADAKLGQTNKNKQIVEVSVFVEKTTVFSGTFSCFILDKHVLDR